MTTPTPPPIEWAMTDQWEQCYDIFESSTTRTLFRSINNLPKDEQLANTIHLVQLWNQQAGLLAALELAQATIERLERHAPGSADGTLSVIHEALAQAGNWKIT